MLLCKIMQDMPDDVRSVVSGKQALKAIADAHRQRSLSLKAKAKHDYRKELQEDRLISDHLAELQDTLLEQNLIRLIEPYSCVEIDRVAQLIKLDVSLIEKKLSQMILDKKFEGVLDQGAGCLHVFGDRKLDVTYPTVLETVS